VSCGNVFNLNSFRSALGVPSCVPDSYSELADSPLRREFHTFRGEWDPRMWASVVSNQVRLAARTFNLKCILARSVIGL
jgi:hypothetical protein